MPCETNRCNQGRRDCPTPEECFPGLNEAADKPVTTPNEAMGWSGYVMYALAIVTCICAVMAALTFNPLR